MDVVINKRKIRDTVRHLVDNGQKDMKLDSRNYFASPVFQIPGLIQNGFSWNPSAAAGTFMVLKQF